jgi:hypothetical protein
MYKKEDPSFKFSDAQPKVYAPPTGEFNGGSLQKHESFSKLQGATTRH